MSRKAWVKTLSELKKLVQCWAEIAVWVDLVVRLGNRGRGTLNIDYGILPPFPLFQSYEARNIVGRDLLPITVSKVLRPRIAEHS